MEILILLTILLIAMLLGGLPLQVSKMCLYDPEQMIALPSIKNNLPNSLLNLAEKLAIIDLCLLNIVIVYNAQKGAQTTLISTEFPSFWG